MQRLIKAARILLATGVATGVLAACGHTASADTPPEAKVVCADDQLSEFLPGSRHVPIC